MGVVAIQKPEKAEKMRIFEYDFTVKYYPESDEAKVPYQVTPEAAGYDLYAAEEINVLPKSNAIASLDLRWAIPKGFYGKIFSRSGLFLNHSITAEAGVIDSEVFSVKIDQKIAQLVFMEMFDVNFEMAQSPELLDKSVRNVGGFGSTGNN